MTNPARLARLHARAGTSQLGSPQLGSPAAPPSSSPVEHRLTPAQVAASLESACRGWVVFWSPWRRTFTAIACFTREPVIVDEPMVHQLLDRIGRVEMAATRHLPIKHGQPTDVSMER